MKLQLTISVIALLTLKGVACVCDGVIMEGVYHEKELLIAGLFYPYQMAVDYSLNILYLSVGDYWGGRTAEFNLETKTMNIIESVPAGFGQAVDQNTHNVYIGGNKGLFQYNPITKETKLILSEGIQSVYFKNMLYYVTYDTFKIFILNDNPIEPQGFENSTVYRFAVDKDDEIIYCDSQYNLQRQKLDSINSNSIETINNWCTAATDVFGNAYVTTKDGIYTVNKCNDTLNKIVDVNGPYSVTFDRYNHLIYATDHNVYRLKPDAGKTC